MKRRDLLSGSAVTAAAAAIPTSSLAEMKTMTWHDLEREPYTVYNNRDVELFGWRVRSEGQAKARALAVKYGASYCEVVTAQGHDESGKYYWARVSVFLVNT